MQCSLGKPINSMYGLATVTSPIISDFVKFCFEVELFFFHNHVGAVDFFFFKLDITTEEWI